MRREVDGEARGRGWEGGEREEAGYGPHVESGRGRPMAARWKFMWIAIVWTKTDGMALLAVLSSEYCLETISPCLPMGGDYLSEFSHIARLVNGQGIWISSIC